MLDPPLEVNFSYRELALADGLGTADANNRFGASIVPPRRKLGNESEAGAGAASRPDG